MTKVSTRIVRAVFSIEASNGRKNPTTSIAGWIIYKIVFVNPRGRPSEASFVFRIIKPGIIIKNSSSTARNKTAISTILISIPLSLGQLHK